MGEVLIHELIMVIMVKFTREVTILTGSSLHYSAQKMKVSIKALKFSFGYKFR